MKLSVPEVLRLPALAALVAMAVISAGSSASRYQRFDEVREILVNLAGSGADIPNAASWDVWIRARDREIRARIDRGLEDSISNLILYGSSFTPLPRIERAEEVLTPSGRLSEVARARVHAFASALSHRVETNERLQLVYGFLLQRGVTPPALPSVLETNLVRFAAEQRGYQDTLEKAAQRADAGELMFTRSTLFRDRGLSVDTSLLPNFALEDTLRAMIRKGVLSPGEIRRIAVIGPGLDFTDKRDGYDYYPLQTIQPFAIMEAVARLALGAAAKLDVTTFDLNPSVIEHVRGLVRRARAGQAYTIQLPRDIRADWKPEAQSYWRHFGDILGSPVPPIAVAAALKREVVARAVAIQPHYALHLNAADLDVVAQTVDIEPGAGFDLVVATNILLYYDLFQQAFAKSAIARMMNPGGVLLVNHALPRDPAGALEYLGRRSVSYSSTGAYGDDVVAYRRRQ